MKAGNSDMLRKGDLILTGVLLLVTCTIFLSFKLYEGSGNDTVAVIRHNNKIIRKAALNKITKTETIVVGGRYKDIIEIKPGHIRFKEANCPDRSCVSTGWISKRGQTAVCLPNRTIIEIVGADSKIDDVAY